MKYLPNFLDAVPIAIILGFASLGTYRWVTPSAGELFAQRPMVQHDLEAGVSQKRGYAELMAKNPSQIDKRIDCSVFSDATYCSIIVKGVAGGALYTTNSAQVYRKYEGKWYRSGVLRDAR